MLQNLRRLIQEGREALQTAPSSKPVDTAKVQHLAQQVRQLEEKAASADASLDRLNAELDQIGLDALTKEEALAVAKEIGVHSTARTPATEIVVQIRRSCWTAKRASKRRGSNRARRQPFGERAALRPCSPLRYAFWAVAAPLVFSSVVTGCFPNAWRSSRHAPHTKQLSAILKTGQSNI